MLRVEIFCDYISTCSKSEVSFVNEMLSLIKKKEVLNLVFVFRLFDLHTNGPYLFQQDAVIMRNRSKFPNFKFPNFLNKIGKPSVVTFRKENEQLSIEKKKF